MGQVEFPHLFAPPDSPTAVWAFARYYFWVRRDSGGIEAEGYGSFLQRDFSGPEWLPVGRENSSLFRSGRQIPRCPRTSPQERRSPSYAIRGSQSCGLGPPGAKDSMAL